MNYFTKKNIIILSIAILLIVNIATISTVIYLTYKRPPIPDSPIPESPVPRESFREFRRDLNLSREQQDAFDQEVKGYRERTQNIFIQLHERRKQMIDEFSKINSDSMVLYQLAKETGALHEELKRMTIDHLLSLKSICTEEQFRTLEVMFRQHLVEDEPFKKGPGFERKYRNRRNKQSNN